MAAKKNSKKEYSLPESDMQAEEHAKSVEEKNTVEALLFASGKYMPQQNIAELCGIDKRKVLKILEELKEEYDKRNTALMIVSEADSWKINVREKYLSTVRKIVAETELPRSTLETLAVIAWKSPIFQSEIVRIRGNKCYDHIAELENAGFVTKDKKGRSFVLKTTEKFFEYFDIDKGNLKGILEEAKAPEPQKTLVDAALEETTLQEANPEQEKPKTAVEIIDLKKKTETEEEKESHRAFLEQIEQKIAQAAEKNNTLDQELPKRVISLSSGLALSQPAADASVDNIGTSTGLESNSAYQSQGLQDTESPKSQDVSVAATQDTGTIQITDKDAQQMQQEGSTQSVQSPIKPKSLTKKQLEKKFKEELLKVREKMEKKDRKK